MGAALALGSRTNGGEGEEQVNEEDNGSVWRYCVAVDNRVLSARGRAWRRLHATKPGARLQGTNQLCRARVRDSAEQHEWDRCIQQRGEPVHGLLVRRLRYIWLSVSVCGARPALFHVFLR